IFVRTVSGTVHADTVVLCAGMWTRQLAEVSGYAVTHQPVEHHYVLSHSIGRHVGGLPIVRDPDGSIYIRGNREVLLLAAFQRVRRSRSGFSRTGGSSRSEPSTCGVAHGSRLDAIYSSREVSRFWVLT